jgi:hypothetical protein
MDWSSWWADIEWSSLWTIIPASAIVSLVTTLVFRWLDSPRAVLLLESRMVDSKIADSFNRNGARFAFLTLTNAGDGNAYEVEIYGHLADLAVDRHVRSDWHPTVFTDHLAVLKPGESVEVEACTAEEDVKKAEAFVRWTTRPGRSPILGFRPRIQQLIYDIPVGSPFPAGLHGTDKLPRVFRRFRRLHNVTPRGRLASPWDDSESPKSTDPEPDQDVSGVVESQ